MQKVLFRKSIQLAKSALFRVLLFSFIIMKSEILCI